MLAALATGPGALEAYINRRKLSRRHPHVDTVRTSVVQAIEQTLPRGHAQVQRQGSTYVAVAIDGLSDCDFFVRMDNSLPHVTREQRVRIAADLDAALRRRGLPYEDMSVGQRRIHGTGGPGGAPEFDVVFERFAGRDPAVAPNRRPLSTPVQLAVCALRLAPEVLTHLVKPQPSALIDFVEAEEARAPGGFGPLLYHAVGRIAGGPPPAFVVALQRGDRVKGNPQALQGATEQWAATARRMLSLMDAVGYKRKP